ncbi:MAG: hypothetical protein AAF438_14570 [Pseudomonadota bacterium]
MENGFGLGGQFGYGEDFENSTFVMRRFYWGDCDCGGEQREVDFENNDPGHSVDCYQTVLKNRLRNAGVKQYGDPGFWEDRMPYDERRKIEGPIYDDVCVTFNLPRQGCAIHCTCDYKSRRTNADIYHRDTCSLELPNFVHKKSGFKVSWYKWIGRGMEIDYPETLDLNAALSECFQSLETVS